MKMTKQKMFDMAWTGLKGQGFERAMKDTSCQYRAPDGKRCAIGHCIPDTDYDPKFEGKGAWAVAPELGWGELRDFAEILQSCHDRSESPASVEAALRSFATSHSLTIPAQVAA